MSGSPSIRLASATDSPAVREVIRSAFSPHIARIGREPSPMRADYDELIATGSVYVLELEDRIIGVVHLRRDDPILWVEKLAVHPDYQHRGLGRRLLAFAEDQARAAELTEMQLYANEVIVEDIALYTRVGYIETERRLHNDFHRVFMRKRLT